MQGGGHVGHDAVELSGRPCSPRSGASTTHHGPMGPPDMGATVAVPPSGAVPRELDKITLPPYVIEAPDQLLIEVVQRSMVEGPPMTGT